MSATLTLELDADLLKLAEEEARAHHTTVPDVVAQQLRVMAENRRTSRSGKTPKTDALRGSIKLPVDFDATATLAEELEKKHGGRG
jgi:hypothetical protein